MVVGGLFMPARLLGAAEVYRRELLPENETAPNPHN